MELENSIGLKSFNMMLDEIQHVYYPGQTLWGKVCLNVESTITAKYIELRWKGESSVSFTNRSTGFRRKCSAEEIYLDETSRVIGDESTEIEMKSGLFSFHLSLPEKIPCSFEGRYGRVRYSVQAILVINQDKKISTDALPFTVAPIINLNSHALATLPISESCTKTFMGHTEPLKLSLFLPVRGYVPGQTIPLKITLKNESNVDLKKLRIVFKKVVLYHTLDTVRKHKEIVVEINQPVQRTCELYETEFDVPAVPPSGVICNLIVVGYTLKVETCVDVNEWYYRMFHKNLKIRSSIIIGTMPLENYEDPLDRVNDNKSEISPAKENHVQFSTNDLPYQKSHIYRSSKPDQDDSAADDTKIESFSPLYRVYTFKGSRRRPVYT